MIANGSLLPQLGGRWLCKGINSRASTAPEFAVLFASAVKTVLLGIPVDEESLFGSHVNYYDNY